MNIAVGQKPMLALVLATTFVMVGHAQLEPVTLWIRCEDARRIVFTIRNIGTEDTAVIFGSALANGARYLIDGLTLQVKRPDGVTQRYSYQPRDYPGVLGGRVDDWIVPLPAGAAYSVTVDVADFAVGFASRLETLPQPAQIALRLDVRKPKLSDLSNVKVWTGMGSLASNTFHAPADCRSPIVPPGF